MDAIEKQAAPWVVRRNGATAEELADPGFGKWYADEANAKRYDSIAALWRNLRSGGRRNPARSCHVIQTWLLP